MIDLKNGYTLHVDILGTQEKLKNLASMDFLENINKFRDLVKGLQNKYKINRVEHYKTDALIVIVDGDNNSLKRLIHFSRDLLEKSLVASFPLRGSIIQGIPNDLNSGDPVIDKLLKVEKMQEWIGIMVDIGEELYKEFSDDLITYLIPSKPEEVLKLYRALIWDVPNCDKLFRYLIKDGLVGPRNKTSTLTHAFMTKATNTVVFGIWVFNSLKEKREKDKFFMGIPIKFADMNLRKEKYD